MTTYRKKPIEIEAVQLLPDNRDAVAEWCGGHYSPDRVWAMAGAARPAYALLVKTLEGAMSAQFGDWIIQGVQGEFYPCKPDIFAQTYEEVTA
jgi:hypothetical protein